MISNNDTLPEGNAISTSIIDPESNVLNQSDVVRPGADMITLDKNGNCPCCHPPKPGSPDYKVNDERWSLAVKGRPDVTKLKTIVLTHGGIHFQRNDFLTIELNWKMTRGLIEKGQLLCAQNAILIPMPPSECHNNAMILAGDPQLRRWLGFALSEDGVWRFHSWAVRKEDKCVIETTELRTSYFGIHWPLSVQEKEFLQSIGADELRRDIGLSEALS